MPESQGERRNHVQGAAMVTQEDNPPPKDTIGGTGAIKCLGLSKWGGQWDLMRSLLSMDERPPPNWRMRRGLEMEAPIGEYAASAFPGVLQGARFADMWGNGAVYHPDHADIIHATVDKVIYRDGRPVGVAEIKSYDCSYQPFNWVRLDYWGQVAHYVDVLTRHFRSTGAIGPDDYLTENYLIVMQETEDTFTAIRKVLAAGLLDQHQRLKFMEQYNIEMMSPEQAMQWANDRGGVTDPWIDSLASIIYPGYESSEENRRDLSRVGLGMLCSPDVYGRRVTPRLVDYFNTYIRPRKGLDVGQWGSLPAPPADGGDANAKTLNEMSALSVEEEGLQPSITDDDYVGKGSTRDRSIKRRRVASLLKRRAKVSARRSVYSARAKALASEVKAIDAELRGALVGVEGANLSGYHVTHKITNGRRSFDSEGMREAYPHVFEEFAKVGEDRPGLSIRKAKGGSRDK